MQKLFNKILVPVDFSQQSIKALEKAVELANNYSCDIVIIHVVTIAPFAAISVSDGHFTMPIPAINQQNELQYRINRLINKISPLLNEKKIISRILTGPLDESLINFILKNEIDLLLIGQKSKFWGRWNMRLNPDKIALRTNIAVITIPANKRIIRLLSVLIPVTDFLPVRKLMYGIYMASVNNAAIKLLSIYSENNIRTSDYYLKKSYQLIKDNSNITTVMERIESKNIAEGITHYLNNHQADLLILNPAEQTKMPGIWSSVFDKIIQKYVQTPVLTVNPLKIISS